jgi:hypothetical protein
VFIHFCVAPVYIHSPVAPAYVTLLYLLQVMLKAHVHVGCNVYEIQCQKEEHQSFQETAKVRDFCPPYIPCLLHGKVAKCGGRK